MSAIKALYELGVALFSLGQRIVDLSIIDRLYDEAHAATSHAGIFLKDICDASAEDADASAEDTQCICLVMADKKCSTCEYLKITNIILAVLKILSNMFDHDGNALVHDNKKISIVILYVLLIESGANNREGFLSWLSDELEQAEVKSNDIKRLKDKQEYVYDNFMCVDYSIVEELLSLEDPIDDDLLGFITSSKGFSLP